MHVETSYAFCLMQFFLCCKSNGTSRIIDINNSWLSFFSFSILWPTQNVQKGDECTRDFLFGIGEDKQRSARLSAWFHTPQNYFIKVLSPISILNCDSLFLFIQTVSFCQVLCDINPSGVREALSEVAIKKFDFSICTVFCH